MAKAKLDKKLYGRMRDSGVRKKVARRLAELPTHVGRGKRASKPMREAVDQLEARVSELRKHVSRGDRRASARKAARTRSAKNQKRRAAGRKGARRRGKAK